jgi:hypothetical protein
VRNLKLLMVPMLLGSIGISSGWAGSISQKRLNKSAYPRFVLHQVTRLVDGKDLKKVLHKDVLKIDQHTGETSLLREISVGGKVAYHWLTIEDKHPHLARNRGKKRSSLAL